MPVWAMNYRGRVLRPDLIDGARAADLIRAALSTLYREGRFLGGYLAAVDPYLYQDQRDGDVAAFSGVETIRAGGVLAYRLDYRGGTVLP
jgi:hypothetical protein